MLIKLRMIGLVFIVLLSTSSAVSLQELQKELDNLTKIVNNNGWWYVPGEYGSVVVKPRKVYINELIQQSKLKHHNIDIDTRSYAQKHDK